MPVPFESKVPDHGEDGKTSGRKVGKQDQRVVKSEAPRDHDPSIQPDGEEDGYEDQECYLDHDAGGPSRLGVDVVRGRPCCHHSDVDVHVECRSPQGDLELKDEQAATAAGHLSIFPQTSCTYVTELSVRGREKLTCLCWILERQGSGVRRNLYQLVSSPRREA
jgi:hypothetical protein